MADAQLAAAKQSMAKTMDIPLSEVDAYLRWLDTKRITALTDNEWKQIERNADRTDYAVTMHSIVIGRFADERLARRSIPVVMQMASKAPNEVGLRFILKDWRERGLQGPATELEKKLKSAA